MCASAPGAPVRGGAARRTRFTNSHRRYKALPPPPPSPPPHRPERAETLPRATTRSSPTRRGRAKNDRTLLFARAAASLYTALFMQQVPRRRFWARVCGKGHECRPCRHEPEALKKSEKIQGCLNCYKSKRLLLRLRADCLRNSIMVMVMVSAQQEELQVELQVEPMQVELQVKAMQEERPVEPMQEELLVKLMPVEPLQLLH
ncbi:unnamed protein product [Trichogramma brassicae]|uniref:Uncharacterized protein n=1 Tax=Trichogramma brassicae TaxID=86971 RepID=A0A6H5IXS4_9HYME|nr:unnamed protein product [Trichogramma brassicae]